ncbi:MAG: hypothetical protein KKC68_08065 [Candidatus Thermoplasmatota archaeon]|nr:hypothetical protein [Candidatus Thermoplasmatota archaeon]MBU1941713.1 hypothetical protein [Candidatus Thermoplasmatota archaeon]
MIVVIGWLVITHLSAYGNPIPVYPSPDPELFSPTQTSQPFLMVWIFLIFIINVGVDILILYSGLLLLDRFSALPTDYVLHLSKTTFLLAVILISIIGISVEMVLGAWLGGLFLAAVLIWFSFLSVGWFILHLQLSNGLRLATYALLINIVVWTVFYSI